MTVGLETYAYLCIGCPLGCRLELDESQGEGLEGRGNSCKKGEEFARQATDDGVWGEASTWLVSARVPSD